MAVTTPSAVPVVLSELSYPELHYIPVEEKEQGTEWAAKNIIFAKYNARPFLSSDLAAHKRMIDAGGINEQNYKRIFDPEDGKADFVAADWKSNPIYIHLNNIIEARLQKIPTNLTVKCVDEYAKLKQQRENAKIIGRREYLDFLNDINQKLNFPPLKPTDDPYKYVKQMMQGAAQQQAPGAEQRIGGGATPDGLVDAIKAAIEDNEDLALYNEYIYKGDVEIAIELGIQHYLTENKFSRVADRCIQDLRNFNRSCFHWYTSVTTGKPVIEYIDPIQLYTSGFSEPDGTDNIFWFKEYDVTFAEFTRQFGASLTEDQLYQVFERNRLAYSNHGINFYGDGEYKRAAARIRIGYIEWETQNREVYSEGTANGNLSFKRKDSEWEPSKRTRRVFKKEKIERNYNVWYRAYYIPPQINSVRAISPDNLEWQKNFVFGFEKMQDQQRYGDNRRFSKSSLVVWRNDRMSFSDIMERFMPKINFLWHKYQNNIVQDVNGIILGEELIKGMLQMVDEGKDPDAAKKEVLKKLYQTGRGMAKMTDTEGKYYKPFEPFKSGNMEAAERELQMIMNLYVMMRTALGIPETGEGQDPRPRQSLGGIEIAMQASSDANFFLEKAWMDMVEECGERLTYYIKKISEEGDTPRFRDFKDVVGQANGLLLESLKDIPLHKLGVSVENLNNGELKQYVMQLADKLVAAGALDVEVLPLIMKVDNPKYAAVLMIMKYKAKQKQIREEKAQLQDFQLQLQDKMLQTELAKIKYKEEAKASITIPAQGEVEARLLQMEAQMKAMQQSLSKDQIKNNRLEQDENRIRLEQEAKQRERENNLTGVSV